MNLAPQHRSPSPRPPVSAIRRATALLLVAAFASTFFTACASSAHHRRPRALGFAGAGIAVAGTGVWVAGERQSNPGALPAIGLGIVAVGIIAMVAAGGWIAADVACKVDPDCEDSEECREIPAPPGGIPYKQCVAR